MIRTKIVEVRETDMESANELLKDPHWNLITVVTDNNNQKVKYVLKRKGSYDDKELLLSNCTTGGTDIDKSEEPVIDLSGAVPKNNDNKDSQIRYVKDLSEEEQELIFVDKFINKFKSLLDIPHKCKVYYNGIKVFGGVYTFGVPEDFWRHVGSTVMVKGDTVFDLNGNLIGRLNYPNPMDCKCDSDR